MESASFFERAFADPAVVRLVDEDPGLFSELPEGALAHARGRAIAPALALPRGQWLPPRHDTGEDDRCLGLLVLDGLLLHSILVANEPRSEVVGPGDLLRPWEENGEVASVSFTSRWDVVRPARLAVLDARVLAYACRWPQFMLAITSRAVRRSHWLALQIAINDVRRVDDRLMLFFWHLADRWGRVRPEGILVPLPVTHDMLAQLVCAQRPTVTSALRRLSEAGRIRRRRDRTWLLAPDSQPALPRARRQLAATVG